LKQLDKIIEEQSISSIHFERPNLTYDSFLAIKNNLSNPEQKEYGEDWVLEQRQHKSDAELEKISEAIDQTLDVFELVETWLEPGISERSLSRAIRRELESRSEGQAFDPIVLSGPNTANPHCPASERTLQADDWLLVDQGMTIDGYCSDLTRMFFLGDPDPEIRELYELSKRATAEAFKAVEPGKPTAEVTAVAHDVIREDGYGDNIRHGLGHGVGMNVHEPPSLSSKNDLTLEPGMVVTLEPGIYIDGFGGGRIEHMIHLDEDGSHLLDEPNEHLEEAL
jgi:Xaa-Pro aminopeptidase